MKPSIAQPATINVCSKIHCPFFENQCSAKSCPKYHESDHCHLATVFAFYADGHWLFTANERDLQHIQAVNDGWIACVSSSIGPPEDRQKRTPTQNPPPSHQCDYPHIENVSFSNSPEMVQKTVPISINLLDSIEFEDY